MANNYLQFSVAVGPLTDEQIAWWDKRLTEDDINEDEPVDHAANRYEVDRVERTIDLYAEESGSVEAAVAILQEYLQVCDPDRRVVIEWADTCDRMRPGEFGGGVVLITATDTIWHNTATIGHELLSAAASKDAAGQWAQWLAGYGATAFYRAFMSNAQYARSECVHCQQSIFLDIAAGGGVPDWRTRDGDYGCDGCGTDEVSGAHEPMKLKEVTP